MSDYSSLVAALRLLSISPLLYQDDCPKTEGKSRDPPWIYLSKKKMLWTACLFLSP